MSSYLNDPAARARSYVARRAGMNETALLERRIASLEQAVQLPYRGVADTVPPQWTMVEIVTALPQPSADMVGRLVLFRRPSGFATLNACILDGYGTPRWTVAMALKTLVVAGGDKGAVDELQSIETTDGDTVTFVPS